MWSLQTRWERCPERPHRPRSYSSVLPSRNACNYLKINGWCDSYPSRKRATHFPRITITTPVASTNSRLKTERNPLTLFILVILQTQLLGRSSGLACRTRKQSSAL